MASRRCVLLEYRGILLQACRNDGLLTITKRDHRSIFSLSLFLSNLRVAFQFRTPERNWMFRGEQMRLTKNICPEQCDFAHNSRIRFHVQYGSKQILTRLPMDTSLEQDPRSGSVCRRSASSTQLKGWQRVQRWRLYVINHISPDCKSET
jgi:hypothetical protein